MTADQVQTGERRGVSPTSQAAAVLVEELIDAVQAGADVDGLIAAHPEHADKLRRLLPAARLLADLSQRASVKASAQRARRTSASRSATSACSARSAAAAWASSTRRCRLSLNRRVALKVLPFAATMDPRQLQRFHHEAQAAALLHHPNIVPVHGVGCERGVHYYAMQLIEGQSLAAVIDEMRPASRGASARPE